MRVRVDSDKPSYYIPGRIAHQLLQTPFYERVSPKVIRAKSFDPAKLQAPIIVVTKYELPFDYPNQLSHPELQIRPSHRYPMQLSGKDQRTCRNKFRTNNFGANQPA